MKKVFFMLVVFLCLALPAIAQVALQSIPLFDELRSEGVKIAWRGKTACCDSWVLTAPNDEVMWLLTQKNMAEVKFMTAENELITPIDIRHELKLDKK